MSTRHLASFVHVDGQVYGPDSDIPTDVAEQITNPKAWGEEAVDKTTDVPATRSRSKK